MGIAGASRKAGLAEIQVHRQYLPALEADGRGKVGGDEGLAAVGIAGGDNHGLVRRGISEHELEVGPHHPEGFVDHVAAPFLHKDV